MKSILGRYGLTVVIFRQSVYYTVYSTQYTVHSTKYTVCKSYAVYSVTYTVYERCVCHKGAVKS